MNKTSKKRAFFVVLAICALHLSVAFKVTGSFNMGRALPDHVAPASPMNIYAGGLRQSELETNDLKKAQSAPAEAQAFPATGPVTAPVQESLAKEEPKTAQVHQPDSVRPDPFSVEPSLLISLPAICLALKEGRIDKEGLIFSKKDAYNSGNWKKPLDILRDRDEEGIKTLLHGIGEKFLLGILRKEGIEIVPDVSFDQLMIGKGYTVDKKKLLSLYRRYVAEGYDDLFPFMLPAVGVIKTKGGFELVESPRALKPGAKEEEEWLMPNLANLPLRLAVERLAAHTSKIKVYGSGMVVQQSPHPFERLRGESECSVQGRLHSQ